MMAPKEFTKVPRNERANVRWIGPLPWMSGRSKRMKGWQLHFDHSLETWRRGNLTVWPFTCLHHETDRDSLLLQDGKDDRLCEDKAVWIHHAILSTYLSCRDDRWVQRPVKDRWLAVFMTEPRANMNRGSDWWNTVGILPTMSFLICSVMGMGLTASGEMYLVKMLTASFSMPGKTKEKTQTPGYPDSDGFSPGCVTGRRNMSVCVALLVTVCPSSTGCKETSL